MDNTERATIGIIGSGLIGTSLALALKKEDAQQRILGYDINETHAKQAAEQGAFDSFEQNPLRLAEHCDILVIAAPVGALRGIFEQIKALAEQVIITDVGSVKQSVINDAHSVWQRVPLRLVPAHPIAGGEESGPSSASADLFRSRYVFITPAEPNDSSAVNKVSELWQKVGAKIELLSPLQHDELFAATSHLPHIVAYALINSLEQNGVNTAFSAGGLKDFTRIAASDPTMWRDISLANADYILSAISAFENSLATIRNMIANQQGDQLLELLNKTVADKAKLNLKD